MRYFTRELELESSVWGVLVYPDSESEWKELVQNGEEHGEDYVASTAQPFIALEPLMLQFLPQDLQQYVHDGSLQQPFPPEHVRRLVRQYKLEFEDRCRQLGALYREYVMNKRASFPPDLLQILDSSLHDGIIEQVESTDDHTLHWNVNGLGTYTRAKYRFTFQGIKHIALEPVHAIVELEQRYWMTEEIHLHPQGFEFSVLLQPDAIDVTIICENIRVTVLERADENAQ